MLFFFLGELKTGFFQHKKGPPRFLPGLPSRYLPGFPRRFWPGFPQDFLSGFPPRILAEISPRFLLGFPPRFLPRFPPKIPALDSPQHSSRGQIKIAEMIFLLCKSPKTR